MNRVIIEGRPFWAVDGQIVSGIGPDGFSYSLRKVSGEYVHGAPAEVVREMLRGGMLRYPERGRGLALRR